MSNSPQLLGILLCERVLQDVLRRDAISLINIHNGITSQSFPTLIPLIYAFAQLSASPVEFNYQFTISDASGNAIAASPLAKVEPLTEGQSTHKVISAFTGLVFKSEGTYKVTLEVGGKEIGSLPFQVVKAQAEVLA
ncbi:MAG TPA: hypothetical protein V6D17_24820 [Candidatus Obscuribacterales bacterium]